MKGLRRGLGCLATTEPPDQRKISIAIRAITIASRQTIEYMSTLMTTDRLCSEKIHFCLLLWDFE